MHTKKNPVRGMSSPTIAVLKKKQAKVSKGGNILLAHGSGGKLQSELIENIILKYFSNPVLKLLEDSAVLKERIAFTTDSYVVKPVFFPGGDIGKLAVSGTVNDILCSGARPGYVSLSLIIEEGFSIDRLEVILNSAKSEARKAGVEVVCGDIKVAEKGKVDEIFINTSGIGFIEDSKALSVKRIEPGDKIIVSGTIGEHGISILSKREGLEFGSRLISDCTSLCSLVKSIIAPNGRVHCLRDPTRGGLGGILAEIARSSNLGIEIEEERIPIKDGVRGACELLGLDPLYIANEGKIAAFVRGGDTKDVLKAMKKDKNGRDAKVIGEVINSHPGACLLITKIGGKRIIDLPRGELLPRIC